MCGGGWGGVGWGGEGTEGGMEVEEEGDHDYTCRYTRMTVTTSMTPQCINSSVETDAAEEKRESKRNRTEVVLLSAYQPPKSLPARPNRLTSAP